MFLLFPVNIYILHKHLAKTLNVLNITITTIKNHNYYWKISLKYDDYTCVLDILKFLYKYLLISSCNNLLKKCYSVVINNSFLSL